MTEAFCRAVDRVNDWTGRIVSLAFIPLVLIVMTEVVLRYFFNSPTIWAWDINIQIAALVIALGGGYTLLHNGHVNVDIVVSRFSARVRAILDMITSTVFFFSLGILFWLSAGEAKISVVTNERYTSLLEPPLSPIRIIIAIGVFLLLMQGVARLIRDIRIVTGKVNTS